MPCFTTPAQASSRVTVGALLLDPFTEKLDASAQPWARQECGDASSRAQGAAFGPAQSSLSAPGSSLLP